MRVLRILVWNSFDSLTMLLLLFMYGVAWGLFGGLSSVCYFIQIFHNHFARYWILTFPIQPAYMSLSPEDLALVNHAPRSENLSYTLWDDKIIIWYETKNEALKARADMIRLGMTDVDEPVAEPFGFYACKEKIDKVPGSSRMFGHPRHESDRGWLVFATFILLCSPLIPLFILGALVVNFLREPWTWCVQTEEYLPLEGARGYFGDGVLKTYKYDSHQQAMAKQKEYGKGQVVRVWNFNLIHFFLEA